MGMVAMTYKLNPDSDVDNIDADAIAETVKTLSNDVYNIQSVEVKPLAFGLQFVQIHVVMDDGEGLADALEEQIASIHGVGELEVLSMGLL
ncbi:MAG: elongation factor 1-beta [Euryarchaeota archaeon]|nr:elongation factor 1-beta [Euryarchaeota archaeon]